MGKSSPKQKVYGYKMSITYGICQGIVSKILKIFIKEKVVYSNPCHGEVFLIDEPKIFGGLKKEGGVQGMVHFQPGDFAQLLHADVAAKLGGTPETLPGHRGISTATFTEGTDGKYSGSKDNPGYEGPGFYWNENQPSIPPAWFMVERIGKPTVLAGFERIVREPGTISEISHEKGPNESETMSDVDIVESAFVDWTRRRVYVCGTAGTLYSSKMHVFDLDTLEFLVEHTLPDSKMFPLFLEPDTGYLLCAGDGSRLSGTGGDPDTLFKDGFVYDPITNTLVTSVNFTWPDTTSGVQVYGGGGAIARAVVFGGTALSYGPFPGYEKDIHVHSFPDLEYQTTIFAPGPEADWTAQHFCRGAANEAWGIWASADELRIMKYTGFTETLIDTILATDLVDTGHVFDHAGYIITPHYLEEDGSLVFTVFLEKTFSANETFVVRWSEDKGIIWATPDAALDPSFRTTQQYSRLTGQYWLLDGSNNSVPLVRPDSGEIGTVSIEEAVPASRNDCFWDATTNCLYTLETNTPGGKVRLDRRCFCDSAVYDMNPIHIIAECLTNGVWGRGLPDTAINALNFQAAAKTIFNEGFGLSMIWTEKEQIEKFIQEVIDHIEATLYINPRNGLFEVKLIRDDYDESVLREVHPGNAVVTKFSRRQTTEIVNEIVLQWTNPDNEKSESLTIQDLGAVVAAGQVNSDGRNYYGIHKRDLAAKVLSRDIRSSASPLAVAEVEADRTFWDVIPGEPIKLWYPEYDIAETDPVIMRVMTVNYGKPGSSKIKLKLAEDVFSLTGQALEAPAVTEHDDTPVTPTEADDVRLLTLPYYLTYNFVDPASLSNVVYPEVFIGVLAAEADPAIEFELHGEVVDAAGNTSFDLLDVLGFIAQGTLPADLAWEAESAITGLTATTQGAGPEAGGLMLIAADGDTDATAELVLLVSKSGDTWTVRRGVLDTVPRAWAAGTKVWFLSQNDDFADDTIRAAADVLDYKVLPRTNGGTLAFADAAIEQITTSERPWLPSRPADVAVNGVRFADAVYTTKPATVDITWADRNRETENAQILAWDDAGVTPETGQTVEVDVFDDALTLLHTFTGLTGGSASLDETEFSQTTSSIIRVYAARDGLRSLQYYQTGVDTRGGIGWGEDWGNDWGGTAV